MKWARVGWHLVFAVGFLVLLVQLLTEEWRMPWWFQAFVVGAYGLESLVDASAAAMGFKSRTVFEEAL